MCKQHAVISMYCFLLGASCRWVLPFIGHMGICTSAGVIRDFAGSYFVSVSYLLCSQLIHVCIRCSELPRLSLMAQESEVLDIH